MHDFVDESDLRLINCLQIRPRASWAALGRVLQLDPATVARRWDRLQRAGLAWVTCHHGRSNADDLLAYVEVEIAGTPVDQVAREVAHDPMVVSVHHTTGFRSLVLSVMAPDPLAISSFVSEFLAAIPGVTAARTEVVTRRYADASAWRLDALTHSEVEALQKGCPRPEVVVVSSPPSPEERALLHELVDDGRISTMELARRLEVSEATVRRRLNRLFREGRAALRCEVSQAVSGWPHTGILWARAPIDDLDRVAHTLAGLPVVRACLTTTGRHNIMLFAWLRDVAELHQLERQVINKAPELEVIDRAYSLRSFKRIGLLLDETGHSTGAALAPWRRDPSPQEP